MNVQQSTGFVLWLTGMARAGKTFLAEHIKRRLLAAGRKVEVLDGDEPDNVLTIGLGSSKEDHDTAARRLGYVAKLLAGNGVVAVCAALSPRREGRDGVRKDIRRLVEVFVDCPMETLLARDSGGLYEKALKGEVKNVTGIDDPYEPPVHAEVVVHSDRETVEEEGMRLFQALFDLKYIAPSEFVRLTGGHRPRRAKPARPSKKGARGKTRPKAAARKVPQKAAARTARAKSRARR